MPSAFAAVSSPTNRPTGDSRISLLRSSLALYAAAPETGVSLRQISGLLASCGLISSPLGDQAFLAGDRFFQHISFLGCAPAIALRPEQSENFLRINISCSSRPLFFAAPRAYAPLCPHCRNAFSDGWKQAVESSDDGMLTCDGCGRSSPISQINFRRRACYSRAVIRISPVFESEAVPAPNLLALLASEFDVPFHYAYL